MKNLYLFNYIPGFFPLPSPSLRTKNEQIATLDWKRNFANLIGKTWTWRWNQSTLEMVSDFFLQSCYQTTIYIFVLRTKLRSHFLTIPRRLSSTKGLIIIEVFMVRIAFWDLSPRRLTNWSKNQILLVLFWPIINHPSSL